MTRIYCLKKKVEKRKSVFFFKKRIHTDRRKPGSAEVPPPPRPLTSLHPGSVLGPQPASVWGNMRCQSAGGSSSIKTFPTAVPMMAGTFLSSLSCSFFLQLVLFILETSPEPHFVSGSFVPGLCCTFFPTGSPLHCPTLRLREHSLVAIWLLFHPASLVS